MSRFPAKSGNATTTKSLKEKWLSIVQLVTEKGEKGIGGPSTVTICAQAAITLLQSRCHLPGLTSSLPYQSVSTPGFAWIAFIMLG